MKPMGKMFILGLCLCLYGAFALAAGPGEAFDKEIAPNAAPNAVARATASAAVSAVPKADAEAGAKAKRMREMLSPSAREKLAKAAAAFEKNADFSNVEGSAATSARGVFDVDSSQVDIESVAFLVLQQAYSDMEEDLKAVMGEMNAMNDRKKKLRESMKETNRTIEDERSRMKYKTGYVVNEADERSSARYRAGVAGTEEESPGSTSRLVEVERPRREITIEEPAAPIDTSVESTIDDPAPEIDTSIPGELGESRRARDASRRVSRVSAYAQETPVAAKRASSVGKTTGYNTEYVKTPKYERRQDAEELSLRELRAERTRIKNEMDSLDGLSEEMSLRLQTLMDRRAKVIQTMSNIMKKISTTNESVVQNLK